MPDLNLQPTRCCVTCREWSTQVPKSKGTGAYTVRFERLEENQRNLRLAEYDFTCTCPHFQHRLQWQGFGYCKHIKGVKAEHCGWVEAYGGGPATELLTEEERAQAEKEDRCPMCGQETFVMMIGV